MIIDKSSGGMGYNNLPKKTREYISGNIINPVVATCRKNKWDVTKLALVAKEKALEINVTMNINDSETSFKVGVTWNMLVSTKPQTIVKVITEHIEQKIKEGEKNGNNL